MVSLKQKKYSHLVLKEEDNAISMSLLSRIISLFDESQLYCILGKVRCSHNSVQKYVTEWKDLTHRLFDFTFEERCIFHLAINDSAKNGFA